MPFFPSYGLCPACARGDHQNCRPSFMQYDVWTWCNCDHFTHAKPADPDSVR